MPRIHEIRCNNQECPSRRFSDRGARAATVEEHEHYITITWRCRRCKTDQRTPLPRMRGESPPDERS